MQQLKIMTVEVTKTDVIHTGNAISGAPSLMVQERFQNLIKVGITMAVIKIA